MILIAVGNGTQTFGRLLDAVEDVWRSGGFGTEEIVVQRGSNPPCEGVPWRQEVIVSHDEFRRLVSNARVVICHAGAGTLLDVLPTGQVPLVMPRRREMGEIVDDHQVELALAFEREGRVVLVESALDLHYALSNLAAATDRAERGPAGGEELRSVVASVLRELEARKPKRFGWLAQRRSKE